MNIKKRHVCQKYSADTKGYGKDRNYKIDEIVSESYILDQ